MKANAIIVSLLIPFVSFGGTTRYVSHSGSDGTYATLQAAVADSGEGDVVVVEASTDPYPVSGEVTLSAGITIVGSSGDPADVVIEHPATDTTDYRVFTLDNSGAKLKDITICGGKLAKTVAPGGGVQITANGGHIEHCIIKKCNATWYAHGGGIYIAKNAPATVDRCVITDCTNHTGGGNDYGGAGIYLAGGTVRNCLIVGNHETGGSKPGGAVRIDGGILENCTICGNDSATCAGVYAKGGTVRNCLIGACTTTGSLSAQQATWDGDPSLFVNCVSDVEINGTCDIEPVPFADAKSGDWYPAAGSASIDGATEEDWMVGAQDLAGNDRIRGDKADIGAYESDPNAFSASFSADVVSGLEPLEVEFTATVSGAKGDVSLKWDWNGDGSAVETVSELVTTHAFAAGSYSVKLTVVDDEGEHPLSATVDILVGASTINVALGEDISAALGRAVNGTTIVLARGTHEAPSEIAVKKGVTIRGETGNPADVTVHRSGSSSYRLFLMDHAGAKLEGLTVSGGSFVASGDVGESGAGVCFTVRGGKMENCIVTGCRTEWFNSGGGVFIEKDSSAVIDRCIISNCTNKAWSGYGGSALAMAGGTVRNCLFTDNHQIGSVAGGTVYIMGGALESCSVGGNDSTMCAGVVASGGTVRNCLIGACTTTGSISAERAVWDGVASPFVNCVSDVEINGTCDIEPVPFADAKSGDWYPAAGSASIDGVTEEKWMVGAKDLAGNDRIRGDKADIGAYESDPNAFSASFSADVVSGLEPLEVKFKATVSGAKGDVSLKWDWNGDGSAVETVSELVTTHAFAAGSYTVKLTVVDDEGEHPLSATVDILVGASTINVALGEDISAALGRAVNGTTIVLARGTHEAPSEIVVKKGVTIRGETGNPADVTVHRSGSSSYRLFLMDHAGAKLEGLTVSGGSFVSDAGMHGAGVYFTVLGGKMENCVVTGCRAEWWNQGGGAYIEKDSAAVVDRCVFSNCTNKAYGSYGGSALAMSGGTVRNCLFTDNHQIGDVAGGTILVGGGTLENCTIAGNDAVKCAGIVASGGGAVRNCLISACDSSGSSSSTGAVWDGSSVCFSHCVAEAEINTDCRVEEAAKTFTNPARGIFGLKSDSCAVNYGLNADWMQTSTDLRGRSRISGRSVDVGCYEHINGLVILLF